jgi:hypothetical protein
MDYRGCVQVREEKAAGTHLSVPAAVFFLADSGNIETGGSGASAGWTSGDGARAREEEAHRRRAAGTHFRVSVADFLGHSARGWETLRLGEALVVMDGRTGGEFDVGGMRRWGRRATIFACPWPIFWRRSAREWVTSRVDDVPRVLDRWVSQFFIIGEEEVMVLCTWFPPLLLLSLLRLFDQEGWGIQSGETGVLG